jgi:P27 family predicted phage terminase small subunit
MKGRPPKTTAQHKADGTYHATKHRDRQTFPMLDAIPKHPAYFSKEQAVKWNTICAMLQRDGMLSDTYLELLERYCNAWETWSKARVEVDQLGITLVSDKGSYYKNPAILVEKDMLALMVRILEQFGYTPRAAMSMKSTGKEKQDDDPAGFLDN